MYGINAPQWDLIRKTATDGRITPDGLDQLNLGKRDRDQLETSLRTYFQDRVDFAVPTPGASERRILLGDTRAGTPLGEAIRLMMIFKAFPATVANKIMTRDVYGRGATSAMDWLMNDHQGKFHMASLIAMTTIAGYLGNSMRAMLNGKTPPELASDGKINADVLGEAAIRGGGLGLMGDLILKDYEHQTSSLLENIGGPVLGQADLLATTLTRARHGEPIGPQVGKMITDNMPFINLFYVRPALNYYVLWNIQQMMDPNRIERMRHSAEMQHEQYFMGPAAR
jgi:hypothetical protein